MLDLTGATRDASPEDCVLILPIVQQSARMRATIFQTLRRSSLEYNEGAGSNNESLNTGLSHSLGEDRMNSETNTRIKFISSVIIFLTLLSMAIVIFLLITDTTFNFFLIYLIAGFIVFLLLYKHNADKLYLIISIVYGTGVITIIMILAILFILLSIIGLPD